MPDRRHNVNAPPDPSRLATGGQGLGAALLSPAALPIITATFDKGAERTRALGVWGASAVAGGLGRAFLAAGIIAAAAAAVAVLVLPRAKAFLPKLALAPPVSIH
jgi:MFS family permease